MFFSKNESLILHYAGSIFLKYAPIYLFTCNKQILDILLFYYRNYSGREGTNGCFHKVCTPDVVL